MKPFVALIRRHVKGHRVIEVWTCRAKNAQGAETKLRRLAGGCIRSCQPIPGEACRQDSVVEDSE